MRRVLLASAVLVAAASAGPAAEASNYRGMTAGWPYYANGYYAAYFPQNQGIGPTYYVAQPAVNTAYGGSLTTAMRPTTAAYANPTYFAAYGQSAPAPQQASYAAPATAYYAPTTAYYQPAAPNYAPVNSYAVSPAGGMDAGAEAATYYGQPQRVNYVPPRFVYRTTYAPTPVYMYRPVTAYQPVTGQPTTCLQPTTTTHCMPQRTRDWSWLWPWNWFSHLHHRCGAPAPAPTTSYCGPAPCGQPYYPAPTTVIPTVPGTITTPPVITTPGTTVIPSVPGTPRIPPPGTRVPQGSIILPADRPPSLAPGTIVSPITPGTPTTPGTIIQQPGTIIQQPGTIIQQPGTTPPGSFQTIPQGTNYPPLTDPYRGSSFSSPLRGSGASLQSKSPADTAPPDTVIRAPDLRPALPPTVTTVPDPDATAPPPPANRSPPLINPRDKLATPADHRWGVVPAVWPKNTHVAVRRVERPITETKAFEPQDRQPLSRSPYAAASSTRQGAAEANAPAQATHYDDSGWTSGRSW